METIQIGDTVHHAPTGEDWLVARVTDKHVYPAGWPPCRAKIGDCALLQKATDEQRERLMAELRKLPQDDERRLSDNAAVTRRHTEEFGND